MPPGRDAHLALVAERGFGTASCSQLDIGVSQYDGGVVSTEFECHPFETRRGRDVDAASGLLGAREMNHVDPGVGHQCLPGRSAAQYLDDPGRKPRLVE